ncbi:hypothetical protein Tco_0300334 [Tanacetum coccineum]
MEASRAFQAGKHDKGQESLVPRSLTSKKGMGKGRGLHARADVHSLADTICSAIDVMEAIATYMDHLNSLAYDLASAMKVEYSLLDQCKDQFSELSLLELGHRPRKFFFLHQLFKHIFLVGELPWPLGKMIP